MENDNNLLLLILLGVVIIVGVVGSIAYYFARYGIKSPGVEEKPQLPLHAPKVSQAPDPGLAPSETVVDAPKPLTSALSNTRESIWGRLKNLVGAGGMAPELRDEIEEILYTSDLGVPTVERLMEALKKSSNGVASSSEKVRAALKQEMLTILGERVHGPSVLQALELDKAQAKPVVWLVVGVNGAGKTTTIGKLAFLLAQANKKVIVAAGDTFRAAAGEQLKIWTERAQVEIFAPEGVMDPAAVAYQAVEKAKANGSDIVIIDTAGRLHTQKNLMEELKKVKRVLAKVDPTAPHQTLLVLDANSGQNAIVQAREFNGALELTGIVLTKMDGTAKGGVALSLAVELNLPPRLIGVGEKVTDLRPFNAEEFVNAIL